MSKTRKRSINICYFILIPISYSICETSLATLVMSVLFKVLRSTRTGRSTSAIRLSSQQFRSSVSTSTASYKNGSVYRTGRFMKLSVICILLLTYIQVRTCSDLR